MHTLSFSSHEADTEALRLKEKRKEYHEADIEALHLKKRKKERKRIGLVTQVL
jgi:hypothetical protein